MPSGTLAEDDAAVKRRPVTHDAETTAPDRESRSYGPTSGPFAKQNVLDDVPQSIRIRNKSVEQNAENETMQQSSAVAVN